VIDDLPLAHQDDLIEEIEHLRGGLRRDGTTTEVEKADRQTGRRRMRSETCKRETQIVVPRMRETYLMALKMSKVVRASRPLDTASINLMIRGGSIISPTVTRLFCPPLTPRFIPSPTMVFAQSARPRTWRTLWTWRRSDQNH
jgi:hypothetical protein